jgi:hypothetical protein
VKKKKKNAGKKNFFIIKNKNFHHQKGVLSTNKAARNEQKTEMFFTPCFFFTADFRDKNIFSGQKQSFFCLLGVFFHYRI